MVVCATTLSLLLVFLFGFVVNLSLAHNHVYHVGEHDGWTLLPLGKYNHWAQKHRLQVNDDLVFKYQKGNDSVLVVGEDDYNKCNKKNPIHTLTDGYSKFKLTRSGPFFFISGHGQRCENGQKLTTVVPSNHHSTSSTAPSPSPSAKTPSHAPPLHQPSHSPSPKDSPPLPHSPSPITPTHAPPPSHTPSPSSHKLAPPLPHSPSPAPSVITPTHAPPPSHAPAHAPPPPAPVSHHSPPQTDADQSISRPPHHAPAPAPSSASLVLTRGLGVVATIVCAMIVV